MSPLISTANTRDTFECSPLGIFSIFDAMSSDISPLFNNGIVFNSVFNERFLIFPKTVGIANKDMRRLV